MSNDMEPPRLVVKHLGHYLTWSREDIAHRFFTDETLYKALVRRRILPDNPKVKFDKRGDIVNREVLNNA